MMMTIMMMIMMMMMMVMVIVTIRIAMIRMMVTIIILIMFEIVRSIPIIIMATMIIRIGCCCCYWWWSISTIIWHNGTSIPDILNNYKIRELTLVDGSIFLDWHDARNWMIMITSLLLTHIVACILGTVYPKKYAHGLCFAVLCCGYTLTDFPISIRLTSLALWQSDDCPSASKATLMNMDK